RAAIRARHGSEALSLMDQVVARDPNFAPGWRFLASARNLDNLENRNRPPKAYPENDEALARKVITLAPDSSDGYPILANLAARDNNGCEALQLGEQALARDPNDPEILNGYSIQLWRYGYLKKALEERDRQRVLEPLVPVYALLRGEVMLANGMPDQALKDW